MSPYTNVSPANSTTRAASPIRAAGPPGASVRSNHTNWINSRAAHQSVRNAATRPASGDPSVSSPGVVADSSPNDRFETQM